MTARNILLIVGAVFLWFAMQRIFEDRRVGPAACTWLLVGVIILVVSQLALR